MDEPNPTPPPADPPAGDPPAGNPPAGDPPAGTPPAADPPAGPYRLEGVPDNLFGETDHETIDKMAKALNQNRQQARDRGKVPGKAEDYALPEALPDGYSPDVKQFLGELGDDPVFHTIRDVMHAQGVTDKQFAAIVPAVFQQMLEGELMEPLLDPVAERKLLVPDELQSASTEDQGKAVDQRLNENRAWLSTLANHGGDDEGLDAEAITAAQTSLIDTAAGNRAIEFFRKLQGSSVNPATGGAGAGGMSEAELKAMNADPRNDPSSPKYDKAFAAQVSQAYKTFHGG